MTKQALYEYLLAEAKKAGAINPFQVADKALTWAEEWTDENDLKHWRIIYPLSLRPC